MAKMLFDSSKIDNEWIFITKFSTETFQSAHILTGSHFSQTFRLGYKLLLICVAKGVPTPTIKWYKEGAELQPKPNAHVSQADLA